MIIGHCSAFGWRASRALLYGLMHGVWCAGSPGERNHAAANAVANGHNLAMIVVTIIMLSEHLEHPQCPLANQLPYGNCLGYLLHKRKLNWGQLRISS